MFCDFFLFSTKYIIGKIPQVLNINKQTNRATCFLVHALYAAIHFNTKSNIAKTIHKIISFADGTKFVMEFRGIIVILFIW